jgi:hypothetical protein
MDDKLRFAISNTDNPKLLGILAKMAELPDETQGLLLQLIETGAFSDEEFKENIFNKIGEIEKEIKKEKIEDE